MPLGIGPFILDWHVDIMCAGNGAWCMIAMCRPCTEPCTCTLHATHRTVALPELQPQLPCTRMQPLQREQASICLEAACMRGGRSPSGRNCIQVCSWVGSWACMGAGRRAGGWSWPTGQLDMPCKQVSHVQLVVRELLFAVLAPETPAMKPEPAKPKPRWFRFMIAMCRSRDACVFFVPDI